MNATCANSKMRSLSGGKVLDVATGAGEFIRVMMRLFADYEEFVGIDSSDRALAAAKKAFADDPVTFEAMDASKMAYIDGAFDTVAISNSLHHLSDRDDVLGEMLRVLRPGGNFIVREMIRDGEQSPAQMNHVDLHHWWAKIDTILDIHHQPTYTAEQLEAIMRALPLDKLEKFEFNLPVDDNQQAEIVERMTKMIDPYVDRVQDHSEYASLKQEGEELKSRLRKSGFAPATTVFYFGVK